MSLQLQQMLLQNGINPASLNAEQLQAFPNQSPASQAKTIQAYSQNLQQHHNAQLPNKPMPPNVTGPQGQGSPMAPQVPDGATINAYYNAGEMGGPGMRAGPGAAQAGGGSNHALQDYQMQLMLLEQQNKKRLMMARQEQDVMVGIGRADGTPGPVGVPGVPGAPGVQVPPGAQGPPGAPGVPVVAGGPGVPGALGGPGAPNAGQPFQGASPQGGRPGASPSPAEQMKRNNQQLANAGMGSPLPDNPQSRGSPNPVTFMGAHMEQPMAPGYNMVGPQMSGMRTPGPHPGMQFNGPMNTQLMANARQQQAAAAAAAGQGGPPMQWQQQPGAPNGGQMGGPQGPPAQQVQGTPQQRSMPPPSAPGAIPAAANTNQRTQTASPQTGTAAPPTPQQSAKANPKKKDGKGAKKVRLGTVIPHGVFRRLRFRFERTWADK